MVHSIRTARVAVPIAIAAAIIAAFLAFALSSSGPHSAGAAREATSTGVTSHFSALQQAPPDARKANPYEMRQFGMDPASARVIPTKNGDVWVAASSDFICINGSSQINSGSSGSACTKTAYALSYGVISTSKPAPDDVKKADLPDDVTELFALVPDEVTSVRFTNEDGSVELKPEDGVIVHEFSSEPDTARFTTDDGPLEAIKLH